MLKKYQPERTDFLLNTQWGIPRNELSVEEAGRKGMVLFHDRWVTKGERTQIRNEYHVYRSIRFLGVVMICMSLPLLSNIGVISKQGVASGALAVGYAMALVAGGVGLMIYARVGQYLACMLCASFLVLPFTPLMQDVKEAPLLIFMGILGFYYLLRKTTRKLFNPISSSVVMFCATSLLLVMLLASAGTVAASDDNDHLLKQFLSRNLEPASPLDTPASIPPSEALFFYLNKGYGAVDVVRENLAKGPMSISPTTRGTFRSMLRWTKWHANQLT